MLGTQLFRVVAIDPASGLESVQLIRAFDENAAILSIERQGLVPLKVTSFSESEAHKPTKKSLKTMTSSTREAASESLLYFAGMRIGIAAQKQQSALRRLSELSPFAVLLVSTALLIATATIITFIVQVSYNDEASESTRIQIASSTDAYFMATRFVRESLKSPRSAKFPPDREATVRHLGDNQFVISSYVDAENSFGALIRSHYICVIHSNDGNTFSLDSLVFE